MSQRGDKVDTSSVPRRYFGETLFKLSQPVIPWEHMLTAMQKYA